MSDVKDILNLPKVAPKVPSKTSGVKKEKERKPEGISREVYALTKDQRNSIIELPPLMPTLPSFREKKNQKAVAWEWRGFKNSARSDDAVFYHWVKKDDDSEADYPFAKFNKRTFVYDYTDQEYKQHLEDESWTREETDHLFQLCKDFDLRFIVIADRFEYPNKSVDDLKERYYSVAKRLLEARNNGQDISENPLVKFPFNKAYEVERKKQIDLLFFKTKDQLKEEEELQEQKKPDFQQKKTAKDKKKGVKGAELTSQSSPSPLSIGIQKKEKKKKVPSSTQPLEHSIISETGTSEDSVSSKSQAAGRKDKAILGAGIFLRSNRVWGPHAAITARMQKKIELSLEALGVALRPLPTAAVHTAFSELKSDICTQLELEAQLEKKEAELRQTKQLSSCASNLPLASSILPSSPSTSSSPFTSTSLFTDSKTPKPATFSSETKGNSSPNLNTSPSTSTSASTSSSFYPYSETITDANCLSPSSPSHSSSNSKSKSKLKANSLASPVHITSPLPSSPTSPTSPLSPAAPETDDQKAIKSSQNMKKRSKDQQEQHSENKSPNQVRRSKR
eukprot:TRINITY_DN854_c0_g1_i1.p1 TRINITY_DN854_c0_g1~~TRINITY_DN854_c0_g1_i1.p1  ORF type:complete len:575 (+),score=156.92 TRINITY_DN854_c0_g1_i1:35-1726(+)